jgi:hypothetical protein
VDKTLIVLDGDVLATGTARLAEAKNVITGTEPNRDVHRRKLRSLIRPLKPFPGNSPEQMLHSFLHSLPSAGLSSQETELLAIAQSVISVQNKHDLINKIIEKTGENRAVALSRLVALASKAVGWNRYTRVLRSWLRARRVSLNLDHI